MLRHKNLIHKAINTNMTLLAEHSYSDQINELIILEVYPYKIDGEYLICYDVKGKQPYALNMARVRNLLIHKIKEDWIPIKLKDIEVEILRS